MSIIESGVFLETLSNLSEGGHGSEGGPALCQSVLSVKVSDDCQASFDGELIAL